MGSQKMQNLELNYSIDEVYEALIKGITSIKSFKLKSADHEHYFINVGVKMSMMSWGENLTVTLIKKADKKTEALFVSQSKLGTEIVAGSKNQQNISKLINAMMMFLK